MVDIPGLPYDGVTDVVDQSGNGKGVALNVWPSDNRVPIADDPVPLDTFVLEKGELAYAGTSLRLRVGDGFTPGGDEVAYLGDVDEVAADLQQWIAAMALALNGKANLVGGNSFEGNQVVTGNVIVSPDAYGPTWNFNNAVPTKDAVYDKIEAVVTTIPPVASDVAYAASWNGVTTIAPSKNAVYDKVELLTADIAGKASVSQLANYLPLTGGTLSGDLTIEKTNPLLWLKGNASTYYPGVKFTAATGDYTIQAYYGLLHDTPLGNDHKFNTGGVQRAVINDGGLAVTGNINATGSTTFRGGTHVLGPDPGAAAADCTLTIRSTNYYSVLSFQTAAASGGAMVNQGSIYGAGLFRFPSFSFEPTAGGTQWAAIDSTGINIPTGSTYKINGVPIGGGGGAVSDAVYGVSWDGDTTTAPSKNAVYDKIQALTVGGGATLADGDYGDVLVSGTGTAMTVQSAAGNFGVTGNVTATGTINADGNISTGGKITANNGVNTNSLNLSSTTGRNPGVYVHAANGNDYGMELGYAGGYCTRLFTNNTSVNIGFMATSATLQSQFTDWGVFSNVGLAVTGVISATGVITSGGSALATVSQLANYLPLTGGTVTGSLFATAGTNYLGPQIAGASNNTLTLRNTNQPGGFNRIDFRSYATDGSNVTVDATLTVTDGGGVTLNGRANVALQAVGATIATVTATGLAVTGTISATGAITSGGSALATVSQLAAYMPLTGGTFSGQVNHDNNINYFGKASGTAQDSLTVFRNCATYSTFWFNSYDTAGANEVQDALLTSIRNYGFVIDAKPNIELKVNGSQIAILTSTGLAIGAGKVLSVPDDAYAVGWNGSLNVPTKNAVYDKIEALAATIPAAPSTVISDVAYAASWNAVTTIAPSKNAVYDQMELKANIAPGVGTSTSAATLVPVATNDMTTRTTQTVALAVSAPTGTPVNGFGHVIRIKATAAITVSWNAIYRAIGITLPTAIALNKTIYVGMIYNSADSTWDCTSLSVMA